MIRLQNDRHARDPGIPVAVALVLIAAMAFAAMQAGVRAASRSAAESYHPGPVARPPEIDPIVELSPARHGDAATARRIRTVSCAHRLAAPPARAVRSG